jgi:hypothetical protein
VPIFPVCSSQNGRVFLFAHFPPCGVLCDHKPVKVSVTGQVAVERHSAAPVEAKIAGTLLRKQELCDRPASRPHDAL